MRLRWASRTELIQVSKESQYRTRKAPAVIAGAFLVLGKECGGRGNHHPSKLICSWGSIEL
jgi:hypothetical protein